MSFSFSNFGDKKDFQVRGTRQGSIYVKELERDKKGGKWTGNDLTKNNQHVADISR
jgi:hypothetical protein